MKAMEPARQQRIFREAVDYIIAQMTVVERYNFTTQIDSTGQELNQVILFVVRSKDTAESAFLGGVQMERNQVYPRPERHEPDQGAHYA